MFYNQNYFNTDDQSPMLFEFQNALNFNRRLREYIKIVPNWSYSKKKKMIKKGTEHLDLN